MDNVSLGLLLCCGFELVGAGLGFRLAWWLRGTTPYTEGQSRWHFIVTRIRIWFSEAIEK